MKSNSELLLDRMKSEPYSEALYSAATDALTEDGDERRAEWVRRLMELEYGFVVRLPQQIAEKAKLRFWLGLRELRIGDFLSWDESGVFPVDRDSGAFIIGQCLEVDGLTSVICLTGLGTQYRMPVDGQLTVEWTDR